MSGVPINEGIGGPNNKMREFQIM